MKKKVLAVLLGGCMVAGLLAGCGGGSDSSSSDNGDAAATDEGSGGGDYHFEVVVKSFQSTYWQAAIQGIDAAVEELGVKVNTTGPNAESDIADQVNMLNNAISQQPDGIALAANDQSAVLIHFRMLLTQESRLYASTQVCRMLRKDQLSLRSLQTTRQQVLLQQRICMK